MISYKEKLMEDISQLNDDQIRKFYHLFQLLKKEFLLEADKDWRKDFRNISVWENDSFADIAERV